MNTISFYGTDGSGKSTIAREFSALHQGESIMLGGSSYKEWLTPEVARQTLGPNHIIGETPANLSEKMRLYEDIAIACYGFARILNERGQEVVIDSDPYFKRIVWGSLGLDAEQASDYINHFEARVVEGLGETLGPNAIVGVNMGAQGPSHEELMARLDSRGLGSVDDPQEVEEVIALDSHVRGIWREANLGIVGMSLIQGFNHRLASSRVFEVSNPNCDPGDILPQAQSIAKTLRTKIS